MKITLPLLSLSLISAQSLAKVDDVYCCNEVRIVQISEKQTKEYDFANITRKFNFTREATEIIFDDGSGWQRHYLSERKYPVSFQDGEVFQASDDTGALFYTNGLLIYSNVDAKRVFSVIARCVTY